MAYLVFLIRWFGNSFRSENSIRQADDRKAQASRKNAVQIRLGEERISEQCKLRMLIISPPAAAFVLRLHLP